MSDIRSALANIRSKVTSGTMHTEVNAWRGDGIDHINLSVFGKTALGRWLDIAGVGNWDHPAFGGFASLYNFRMYIEQEERADSWRYADTRDLKALFKKELRHTRIRLRNLDAALMHSAYIRVLQHPEVVRTLLECDLPFDSYRTLRDERDPNVQTRERHPQTIYLANGYDEIRSSLRENRDPDFSAMIFVPRASMYEDMIRQVAPEATNREIDDEYEPAIFAYAENLRKAVLAEVEAQPNGAKISAEVDTRESRDAQHRRNTRHRYVGKKMPVHVSTVGGGDNAPTQVQATAPRPQRKHPKTSQPPVEEAPVQAAQEPVQAPVDGGGLSDESLRLLAALEAREASQGE